MDRHNILIVDDEPMIREMIRLALARGPYVVAEAENGKVAVEKVEAEDFDLVILDIIMPEMEGIETMRRLRDLKPYIKILAMSGGGRRGTLQFLEMARQLGADEVLQKPFRRKTFEDVLRRLLGTAEPETALRDAAE